MQETLEQFTPRDSYPVNINEVLEKLLNNSATIALGNSIVILDEVRDFLNILPTLDQETILLKGSELKGKIDVYSTKYIDTLNKMKPALNPQV